MHSSPCQERILNSTNVVVMESLSSSSSSAAATMMDKQPQQPQQPQQLRIPWNHTDALRPTISRPLFHLPFVQEEQQQEQGQQSSKRRRVTFSEQHNSVIPSTSPLDHLSTPEQSTLWYHVTDLDHFRTQVRDLCRQMRVSTEPVGSSTVGTSTYSLGAHFHTRGLEQRACLERQRRKYLAARCILRAQSKVESEEHLAVIAHKCTAWATVLAREEAARDVIRAYGPEPIISIDDDNDDAEDDTEDAATTSTAPTKSCSSTAPVEMNTTSPDKRGLAELLQEAAAAAKAASAEPSPVRRRLNTDGPVFGICRI
jgi:hypothetical protein